MLSNIITADKQTHAHIAVVTSFARQFADDYAGISPRKNKTLFTKYGIEPPQAKVSIRVFNKVLSMGQIDLPIIKGHSRS